MDPLEAMTILLAAVDIGNLSAASRHISRAVCQREIAESP